MHIGDVIGVLLNGGRISKEEWVGKKQYLELQEAGDMTKQFICIVTVEEGRMPWVPTPGDLLSFEWQRYLDIGG